MSQNTFSHIPVPEIIEVDPRVSGVKCDGGNGALGHPAVYYVFDGKPSVTCQYCDREFVKRPV
ncbi:MAG TPA: zinc-finger domain-containing protein [Alphaproteobacteria bacterium]|nr:zinc-finger domain-containing protein [Alphaproteobacteria bacterium]HOO50772.1 zinc-finger domain-containing protein [Alphaproteobacteria bacterium]